MEKIERKILKLQIPSLSATSSDISPKVLLHSCCAPCSAAIIECMLDNKIRPTIFFYNPNIYPEEEYLIRKHEIMRYLKELGLDYADADYDHEQWLSGIKGLEDEPERGSRCLKCFTLRLTETARYASLHGFNIITTTLASSRWKDLDQVNAAGREATNLYPEVVFWDQNWRKSGLTERRSQLLKQNGFYNQQYCGCEFSLKQMKAWREMRDSNL
ncbi:MAG: epoxyqueuosine reductase QueH [Bacteroidaceae bacterium]